MKEKKVYRCPICKACFAEASKLKRHIEPQICCVPCARNERTLTSENFYSSKGSRRHRINFKNIRIYTLGRNLTIWRFQGSGQERKNTNAQIVWQALPVDKI